MGPLVSFVIALLFVGLTFSAILPASPRHVKREELGFGRNGKPLPDLFSATLVELQGGLSSGAFSSVDLVTAYLARIHEVNPNLNAVIETNPYAISDAAGFDAQRAAGTIVGPLHGIPVLVKDNVATARPNQTYMNTTAGSYALLGSIPPSDSTVAAKLKKAGAIILGKANLSQWANYRSTNSTNGWTSRGGQTTGAYWSMQDPSGSSSGSAVGSSIGLAFASLGTETSGSILSPSSRNNLVGIKPSVGLTSRYLVVPISQNQDTVGPIARTVQDAAAILSVIAGFDPNDNYTSAIPFPNYTIPDYTAACVPDALLGARIGIPRNGISVTAANYAEIDAFNASIPILAGLGATIVDNANYPGWTAYTQSGNSTIVLEIDFEYDVATYFNELIYNPTNIHTLAELINFTQTDPLEDWPDRNTITWQNALALNLTQTSPNYTTALFWDKYLGSNATIEGAISMYNLDALIMPTSQSPGIAAIAGYPVVTVPLGYYPSNTTVTYNSRNTLVEGGPHFPFGLSFIGLRFSEEKLISFAYAFEQATQVRNKVDPYVKPNMQLIDVINPALTYEPSA